jgi:thiol:disulfide interchange protein
MKRIIFFIGCCIAMLHLMAQDTAGKKNVTWTFDAVKSDVGYTLSFKATIAKGWKLFSTSMKDDEPNTRITFDSATTANTNITAVKEQAGVKTAKEPLLDNAVIHYYENEATFNVDITSKQTGRDVQGTIVFMVIKGEEVPGPEEVPFRFSIDASGNLVAGKAGLQESAVAEQSLKRHSINLDKPVDQLGGTGAEDTKSKGLFTIFILGFLGGLLGLIMPCTFPMIPLTVSFFTKSANKSTGIYHASLYGFFIFLIYVLVSLPFYFLGASNSDILNNISTNSWLNIIFALVFIVFALSFFGLFEISLPSNVTNTVDSKSNTKTISGIFFMALTLAVVSFSCTGPILGSLLVGSINQDGGAVQLTVALGGFGLALGLPFALFAMFPRWLHSLPRSGSWMDSVKIVFGFIELAFAIKFISNADLVKHWGILKREVFLGIWIVIGLLLVLYLFGLIRFKHEAPVKKLSTLRIAFGLLFLAFTLYLIPGITKTKYANLSIISGIPPPLSYSIYGHELVKLNGLEANITNDYEKALQLAKQQNKPLLIDFTGWACSNCRRMEENVWTQKNVKTIIEKKYILLSLYVDDRKLLPEDQQFLFTSSDGSKKPIKTVGDKYITLQSENFRNASQPLYAIISPDEQLLNLPVGYTPDPVKYLSWLENGVTAFKKVKGN